MNQCARQRMLLAACFQCKNHVLIVLCCVFFYIYASLAYIQGKSLVLGIASIKQDRLIAYQND